MVDMDSGCGRITIRYSQDSKVISKDYVFMELTSNPDNKYIVIGTEKIPVLIRALYSLWKEWKHGSA